MPGRVRVFIASSVDGFIAGLDDDLSWLPQPASEPGGDFGFNAFMDEVGALLMGRRTFEVIMGMDSAWWPYGDRPILVATHRELPASAPATVRAVSGSISEVVAAAREAAGERDVYIDGGALIRQALDAELIDEMVITIIPSILGAGIPLFAGAQQRHALELIEHTAYEGGLIALRYSAVRASGRQ